MDLATNLPLWQVALYGAATFLLSLLLAKRSQVDTWVESVPRLAGLMKILRGVGIDPWLIAQGLVLLFAGRLPKSLRPVNDADRPTPTDPPRKPPRILLCLALAFVGCSSAAPLAPPCDEATLAGIVAECTLRVEKECVSVGVAESQCQPLKDCDKRLDDRAEKCR